MRVAAGSVGLSTPEVNVRLPGALTVRPASEPFLLLTCKLAAASLMKVRSAFMETVGR